VKKPNADRYDPDPRYLRQLIEAAGMTQLEAAARIGIDGRTIRRYLADKGTPAYRAAPYPVQYALEALAD